jgi:hypothetical protein
MEIIMLSLIELKQTVESYKQNIAEQEKAHKEALKTLQAELSQEQRDDCIYYLEHLKAGKLSLKPKAA